ncbi:flagellar hook-length control protein FliK [Phaeobacter italicus]|uniref:flagellar hook-length control protein FliK n=1 Tax=Phaeobacter italicus TaxID=481446 RepID=UPI002430B521|nr:flagellar hook-length control protein FliK [Phaeobacter italicus]MCI5100765.1 flagellar hook-length control protein FliK [Phaeobacter italicus]
MFINALTGPLSGGAQGSEKIQQGESANSRKGASFDAVMAETAETKTGEAAEPAVAAETTENEVAANTDESNENTAKDAAVSDDAPDEGVDTDAPDSVRLDVPRDRASDIAVVTADLVADGGDEGIVSTENPQPVADHEGGDSPVAADGQVKTSTTETTANGGSTEAGKMAAAPSTPPVPGDTRHAQVSQAAVAAAGANAADPSAVAAATQADPADATIDTTEVHQKIGRIVDVEVATARAKTAPAEANGPAAQSGGAPDKADASRVDLATKGSVAAVKTGESTAQQQVQRGDGAAIHANPQTGATVQTSVMQQNPGQVSAAALSAGQAADSVSAARDVVSASKERAEARLSGVEQTSSSNSTATPTYSATSAHGVYSVARFGLGAGALTAAMPQTAALQIESLTAIEPLAGQSGTSLIGMEMPGLSQLLTEATMSPGTIHKPETPRLIANQMAEALATKGDRNVDVALNPKELGHVNMRVSVTETGVSVMIQTERPETGDLMRRHINELADEFRRMGFEDISFQFSGGETAGQGGRGGESGQGSGQGRGSAAEGSAVMADAPSEMTAPPLNIGDAGVDMRM